MTQFIEPISLGILERGGLDDTARHLFDLWLERKGQMPPSSELMGISPYLVIFDDLCPETDSPDILFFGSETSFSLRYPEAEYADTSNPKELLPKEFRQYVNQAYHTALEGGPALETIGTGSLLGPRKPSVIFDRLTLRFKKPMGSYLISYSLVRDLKWLFPEEGRPDHLNRCQQRLDPPQLCSAG